jgi:hypothetical protein
MEYTENMNMKAREINNTKQYAKAFWRGWFSTFQPLYGTPFELPDFERGFERDREAFAGDWQRIESDLKQAMGQISDGG